MDQKLEDIEILSEGIKKYDLSFKLIVIGDSGVGKSCLTAKATKDVYLSRNVSTVGFDFFNFNVKIDEKVIKLQIWDTCGQESYLGLVTNFFRNSSLALIVYSIDK